MGWRYRAGLFLIAAVVIIWVSSAEVTQGIFTDYKQPFAVTYLGASLMVVYLPIAFVKDCIYSYLKRRASRSSKSISTENGAMKMFEIEIQGSINRKDSEGDISAQEEEMLLVPADTAKQNKELTTREVATYGFYIAPIWFVRCNQCPCVPQYLSNAALARTSVASTTVLSSTSGLFTLFIGAFLGQDSLNVTKVVAVFVSMAGVAMTTLGKTRAAGNKEFITWKDLEQKELFWR